MQHFLCCLQSRACRCPLLIHCVLLLLQQAGFFLLCTDAGKGGQSAVDDRFVLHDLAHGKSAIVILAVGGIWAEVVRERSIRLAPVDEVQAMEMIAELRALSPLQGLRGQVVGDLTALAQAIACFSQAALLAVGHGVVEAEVNPLMVLAQGQGVCAVDALVVASTLPEYG